MSHLLSALNFHSSALGPVQNMVHKHLDNHTCSCTGVSRADPSNKYALVQPSFGFKLQGRTNYNEKVVVSDIQSHTRTGGVVGLGILKNLDVKCSCTHNSTGRKKTLHAGIDGNGFLDTLAVTQPPSPPPWAGPGVCADFSDGHVCPHNSSTITLDLDQEPCGDGIVASCEDYCKWHCEHQGGLSGDGCCEVVGSGSMSGWCTFDAGVQPVLGTAKEWKGRMPPQPPAPGGRASTCVVPPVPTLGASDALGGTGPVNADPSNVCNPTPHFPRTATCPVGEQCCQAAADTFRQSGCCGHIDPLQPQYHATVCCPNLGPDAGGGVMGCCLAGQTCVGGHDTSKACQDASGNLTYSVPARGYTPPTTPALGATSELSCNYIFNPGPATDPAQWNIPVLFTYVEKHNGFKGWVWNSGGNRQGQCVAIMGPNSTTACNSCQSDIVGPTAQTGGCILSQGPGTPASGTPPSTKWKIEDMNLSIVYYADANGNWFWNSTATSAAPPIWVAHSKATLTCAPNAVY